MTGLEVNTLYRFDVRTCVHAFDQTEDLCGSVFTSIEVQTGVGPSGPMDEPMVRFVNSSHFVLSWPQPFHVGGPVLRYDYKIASQVLEKRKVKVHFP